MSEFTKKLLILFSLLISPFAFAQKTITVAVIDSGIDLTHRQFQDRLYVNPGETGKDSMGRDKATNNIDDDGNDGDNDDDNNDKYHDNDENDEDENPSMISR